MLTHFRTESESLLRKEQFMMEVLTAVELRFELTHWTQLGLNPSLDLSATNITAAEESREREREEEVREHVSAQMGLYTQR